MEGKHLYVFHFHLGQPCLKSGLIFFLFQIYLNDLI